MKYSDKNIIKDGILYRRCRICNNHLTLDNFKLKNGLPRTECISCRLVKNKKFQRHLMHSIINGIECKKCIKCDNWKPLSEFVKNKYTSDKLDDTCKCRLLPKKPNQSKQERQQKMNAWKRNALKTNLNYKLSENLRNRFRKTLVGLNKSAHTMELVGCDINTFRAHIESQFVEGMTWNNYGYGEDKWHIDHIIPCSLFDLTISENQKKCFNYTNMRPLWQKDNLTKNNKILPEFEEKAKELLNIS